ncbi:MAG: hypothetical protein LIR40_08705, partial [Bacteroidota bacterium]|nr:hypothetical protein [Bacteroidota bacterium]
MENDPNIRPKNGLINKLKTHVIGFDNILYGGLQLRYRFPQKNIETEDPSQNKELNINESSGVVIVIRGPRGVHKTTFALQLLYGLTQSLNEEKIKKRDPVSSFYSINKPIIQLNDMLLDHIISCVIYNKTGEYIKNKYSNTVHSYVSTCFAD